MEIGKLLVDEEYLPTAFNLISDAQRSIFISTFKVEITSKPRGRKLSAFFDTLYKKANEGVDVHILLNKVSKGGSVPITNLYAMRELPKHKIQVRSLRTSRICHAKVIIVDGVVAIFGSHNLSVKSCHNNFEISYLTFDKNLVKKLVEVCNKVWETTK